MQTRYSLIAQFESSVETTLGHLCPTKQLHYFELKPIIIDDW